MDPASPRFVAPDNYSAVPKVLSWFLSIAGLLTVLAKYVTKVSMSRKLSLDDYFVGIALLFSIGYTIAISLAAENGLGQPENKLSQSQREAFEKSQFAADMLYIFTVCFAKASALQLIAFISPVKTHNYAMRIAGALLVIWSIASLLSTAFQCQVPATWRLLEANCNNRNAFWTSYGVINIMMELVLVALPTTVILMTQLRTSQKISITSVFALRIVVIGMIIAELVLRNQSSTEDRTLDAWKASTCVLFIQTLDIIFACVPYLQPVFVSLESGFIRTDDTRRREKRSQSGSNALGYISHQKGSSSKAFAQHPQVHPQVSLNSWLPKRGRSTPDHGDSPAMDQGSQSSRSRIVHVQTTVELQAEDLDEHELEHQRVRGDRTLY